MADNAANDTELVGGERLRDWLEEWPDLTHYPELREDVAAILALFAYQPYSGLHGRLVCPQCQGRGDVPGRGYDDPRWLPCSTCKGDGLADLARRALGIGVMA